MKIVKKSLGFAEMLGLLLKNEPNFCARRVDWPKQQCIWIYDPDYHEGMSVLDLEMCLIQNDKLGYERLWLPNSDDLFSFDWQVMDMNDDEY